MATVTPNFNWPVPTSTDLVKDGATAIEALGDSIDASLVDLKGGTTGQVLSKTSNTDMDFTWVAADDTNAIQNTIVDAKGDLIAASAADTPARLAVGSDGETLVADSSTATGLDWKSAAEQYPWQTWTPTYTRLTIGNGTVVARYQQIGKLVNVFWKLTWGSTTSVTNYPVFSLPVTAYITSNQFIAGHATLQDVGIGNYFGRAEINGGTLCLISSEYTGATWNIAGVIDFGTPATWVSGDVWTVTMTYEAA